ncbi:PepSY domain-containing protein [Defluviimonas sp. SAOS-178_SWC]|uniref:PepSY domain-containing protein n=1 Tax=Defluviimonas sp. SAOS-178_SWC TaxID=3121287 RepID=UPI003221EA18
MKTTLTAFALAIILPAGAAFADDDCNAPRDRWQPHEALMHLARQNGWTVKDFEIDDGCYEIEGRDRDGREIEVKLDPATLQIVEMDYEEKDGKRARNPAPAGTVAPPQNGLFGNGAPPQVQVN